MKFRRFTKRTKMRIWLKLIGCSERPITGHPFYGSYTEDCVGFRKGRKPKVRMGDQLFLYASGGSKRIFALAEAVSDPEPNVNYNPEEKGSCQWNVNVRYLINLPVDSGIHIDQVSTSQRNLTVSVRQQSHVELLPEEYQIALSKMKEKA